VDKTIILPKLMRRDGVFARLAAILRALPLDRPWKIVISEAKPSRSLAQNAYLHGVAYKMLSDFTGYEPEEIASYLLGRYFGWKDKRVPKTPRNPEGMESVPIRTTTTDAEGRRSVLGKLEFAEYVAWIQRFGAKHGVVIPDPDPEYAAHREQEAA
jgi:hypothetical protein